jgi:organic radical activating enzyme
MLSIFVETSCNRYNRDECEFCHVYEPLMENPVSEWHLTLDQARMMADKIKSVEVLNTLAQQEINLTGGEASQNPEIVEICKVFQTVSPHVCLHTNLDMLSEKSKRWERLQGIMELGGRIDITLYPTAWDKSQKHFLSLLLEKQNDLIINVVYENLEHLKLQIHLLLDFFKGQTTRHEHVIQLLQTYSEKVETLLQDHPNCDEKIFTAHFGDTEAFARQPELTLGLSLLPAFNIDDNGHRSMASMPFPRDKYFIGCPAARGSIDIMTIQQNGEMTPCCDVGNLKCKPKFGNLLADSPEEIMDKMEGSMKVLASGINKNHENLKAGKAGQVVEEGIPPYCH